MGRIRTYRHAVNVRRRAEERKVAMTSLDDPDNRRAGLLARRTVAEAYGGLGQVASEAGISHEALYRALYRRYFFRRVRIGIATGRLRIKLYVN